MHISIKYQLKPSSSSVRKRGRFARSEREGFFSKATRGEVLTSRCHGSKIFGRQQTDKITLKSIRTISNFTDQINFIYFAKSRRNFLWDRIYCYLSLEKENDNFRAVFTYSIKRARESRKFHVVVVQRWQTNVQNSVIHVQICCL